MRLKEIYQPIRQELTQVDEVIKTSLSEARNSSILKVNRFLLESGGKRMRPALVILSAKASNRKADSPVNKQLINIAASIELIHMASLIHDDVIDHSQRRHNNPTVNSRWGMDVSITLGDYLYSLAFELISNCGNTDILSCISSATKSMCEGELSQVVERDNLSLLKDRYLMIIKKKTASLFAASCEVGAISANSSRSLQSALRHYGLNFGIAFQIVDDYLDLTGGENNLGKAPGQDISVGEVTLPLLNLLKSSDKNQRSRLKEMLKSKDTNSLERIRKELVDSDAYLYTRKISSSYISLAKDKLKALKDSKYRRCLFGLGDLILKRGFADK
ncbi:MAG: polyprenyl synthetase family protein [Candidatus Omnitrophota bacterium]